MTEAVRNCKKEIVFMEKEKCQFCLAAGDMKIPPKMSDQMGIADCEIEWEERNLIQANVRSAVKMPKTSNHNKCYKNIVFINYLL